jgi:hypothetical protein
LLKGKEFALVGDRTAGKQRYLHFETPYGNSLPSDHTAGR